MGFPGGVVVKNPPANARDTGDVCSISGSRKIPWRRKWEPIPVFLPEASHGQKSLAGCSPQDCKESDTTEQLSVPHTHTNTHTHTHDLEHKSLLFGSCMLSQ